MYSLDTCNFNIVWHNIIPVKCWKLSATTWLSAGSQTCNKTGWILCVWNHSENGEPKRLLSTLHFFFFFHFKKWQESCENLCAVYQEDAVMEHLCQKKLLRFQSGKFWVHGTPYTGQPTEINSDKIKEFDDTHLHYTTRMISDIIQIKYWKPSASPLCQQACCLGPTSIEWV